MKFLRKMFGLGQRPLSLINGPGNVAGAPVMDTGPIGAEAGMALSAVWACVGLISGSISTLPLQTYRPVGTDYNAVDRDHWLYPLLHDSPNAEQTAVDFLDYLAMSVELYGNAYALKSRVGGRVVALQPLLPTAVTVQRLVNGSLQYSFLLENRTYRVGSEDMVHVRGPGGNALGGMSTLSFGRQAMRGGSNADRASAAFFDNAMRPSIVIETKEFMSKENRLELRELVGRDFVGTQNTGRPFIAEGMTVKALMVSPIDAQLLESRAFSIEEICRFFGVPPVMIGHSSKTTSWPQGVEQQVLLFLKFTLRRRLKRIEQAFQKQLLTPEDRAAGIAVEFNLEGLLRGDSAARSSFYQSGLQNGWMTINEVRARENLPPVAGGNVPRMQMQNVPITEAGKPPPATQGGGQ